MAASGKKLKEKKEKKKKEVPVPSAKSSLEVRDLDETITGEEVVAALCITLGKPDLGDQCTLYKLFGGVTGAKKMSPMLRGVVCAQYLGRSSGG